MDFDGTDRSLPNVNLGKESWQLTLDIGASSIGWALVREDAEKDGGNAPHNLVLGVRLFDSGADNDGVSNTTARRTARSARRRLRRKSQSRKRLKGLLRQFGILTATGPEFQQLISGCQPDRPELTDPYALRAYALDHQVSLNEFARILIHLNQRRGYLSNSLTKKGAAVDTADLNSDDSKKGKGKTPKPEPQSAEAAKESELLSKMEIFDTQLGKPPYRTLGEFFHKIVPITRIVSTRSKTFRRQEIWSRTDAQRIRNQYPYYRRNVRAEFDALWAAQSKYYPNILTDKAKHIIGDKTIFFQRRFDGAAKGKIGMCSLHHDERRAHSAHPLVHRFRIISFIDNIRVTPPNRGNVLADGRLSDTCRIELINLTETERNLTQTRFWAAVAIPDWKEIQAKVNVDFDRTGSRECNVALIRLAKAFTPAQWNSLSAVDQESIVDALLTLDDEAAYNYLMESDKWQITAEQAIELVKKRLGVNDRSKYSMRAIRDFLESMDPGSNPFDIRPQYLETMAKAYPSNPGTKRSNLKTIVEGQLRGTNIEAPYDLLPFPPGTVFGKDGMAKAKANRLLLPETGTPITNPIVRKALFEVRNLVNAVIKKFGGKPSRIHVELAREETKTAAEILRDTMEQKKRERANALTDKQINSILGTPGQPTSLDQRLRHRLICEYAKKTSPQCVYCGEVWGDLNRAFDGNQVHIDHVWPRAKGGHDRTSNRVLCCSTCNKAKGDQYPFQWLGINSPQWNALKARLEEIYPPGLKTKKDRILIQEAPDEQELAMRLLAATQHAAKDVAKYLRCLYPSNQGHKVTVSAGNTTAVLRRHWNLNRILWDMNPQDKPSQKELENLRGEPHEQLKNRADHRHHAIDAAVLAFATPGRILQLRWKPQRVMEQGFSPKDKLALSPPWPNFRADLIAELNRFIVSRSPKTRMRGGLSMDTMYGSMPTNRLPEDHPIRQGGSKVPSQVYVTTAEINKAPSAGELSSAIDSVVRWAIADFLIREGLAESLETDQTGTIISGTFKSHHLRAKVTVDNKKLGEALKAAVLAGSLRMPTASGMPGPIIRHFRLAEARNKVVDVRTLDTPKGQKRIFALTDSNAFVAKELETGKLVEKTQMDAYAGEHRSGVRSIGHYSIVLHKDSAVLHNGLRHGQPIPVICYIKSFSLQPSGKLDVELTAHNSISALSRSSAPDAVTGMPGGRLSSKTAANCLTSVVVDILGQTFVRG